MHFTTSFEEESGLETIEVFLTFEENDFFPAGVLSKKLVLNAEEQMPIKSEGTEIAWKEGKDLTKKTIQKKQKNKKSGQQRVINKTVEDESFFNFFKSGNAEEEALADLDDEEKDKVQERLEIDFDIINSFVDEVIPYSLEYFLDLEADDMEAEDYDNPPIDEEDAEESDEGKKPKKKNKKKSRKGSKD